MSRKINYENTRSFALSKDEADVLAKYREDFFIPKKHGDELIYLCGNSLGLQPRGVKGVLEENLETWKHHGVEGHFEGEKPWVTYHKHFTGPLSRLVGAKKEEVVAMNNLTANIHFLLSSFYRPKGKRRKVIIERLAFSSDIYAIYSFVQHMGLDPEEVIIPLAPDNGDLYSTSSICEAITRHGDELAMVFMGGLNYYTGQVLDMSAITKAAHDVGAKAGFDLAHAVGNIPLKLHDWGVDFAAWCSYKYLNAGPGAVSGVFIHEQYATDKSYPRLAGWWGQNEETRFQMDSQFDPTPTAEGWMVSNSSIFNMAGLLASLELFDAAGMEELRKKSVILTGYLAYMIGRLDPEQQYIKMITPDDPNERGCQLSMYVPEKSKLLFESLTKNGVILDWRKPDVIRVAPAPLYNSYLDVYSFALQLERSMKEVYG